MFAAHRASVMPCRCVRKLSRRRGQWPAPFEPLEPRVLLSVVPVFQSSVATLAVVIPDPENPMPWKESGDVMDYIAKGAYVSQAGYLGSNAEADAWTVEGDPGWFVLYSDADGMIRANAMTKVEVAGGPAATAQAISGFDYLISIKQIQILPSAFRKAQFDVPITAAYEAKVKVEGGFGVEVQIGLAEAYVEIGSVGSQDVARVEAKAEWTIDSTGPVVADVMGTHQLDIRNSPSTGSSGYLHVVLNAFGASQVAPINAPAGMVVTEASAAPAAVFFNQVAFDQTWGDKAFPLKNYFIFVMGLNTGDPLPGLTEDDELMLTLGEGRAKMISFTDADGTQAALRLTRGSADLLFRGTGLSAVTSNKGVTVNGTDVRLVSIEFRGDTSAGKLTIVGKGGSDALVAVGSISSQAAVHSIIGKSVDLAGDLTIGGSLRVLLLNSVAGQSQQTLNIGGTAGDPPVAIAIRNAADVTLTSGAPIAALVVGQWQDTDASVDLITAPWMGGLASGGDFGASLTLSGQGVPAGRFALGAAAVKGTITGGTWTVAGAAGRIAANAIAPAFSASFDGAIKTIAVKTNAGGSIEALAIGSVKVGGDLQQATLRLTQPVMPENAKLKALGSLSVRGTMNGSMLESAGHVGTVTLGRLIASTLFAGVDGQRVVLGQLPGEAQDFHTAAAIDKLTVKGTRDQPTSLADSFIAAAVLGSVKLVGLADGAGGGVAADRLSKAYTRKAGNLTVVNLKGPLDEPTQFDEQGDYLAKLV